MRRLRILLVSILALASAPSVALANGVIEINGALVQAGTLIGDSPGYPLTITRSGSYRLVGKLSQLALSSTSASDMIQITADNVTLDLNGFAIECTRPFIPTTIPCTHLGGFASGIVVQGDNVEIRNGSISGMPLDGISANWPATAGLVVRDVRSVHNGNNGIAVGSETTIRDSIFRENGNYGIFMGGPDNHLRDVQTRGNATGLYRAASFEFGGSMIKDDWAGPGAPLNLSCSWIRTGVQLVLLVKECP